VVTPQGALYPTHTHTYTHTYTHTHTKQTHLQDPVVTPQGVLYSREAILENLLSQKKAIKKKLAAWEAAQAADAKKVFVCCI